MPKYLLYSRGENYFHFRNNPRTQLESFSVTYCHDGTVCMTGDMGCLIWQRHFTGSPDYGFPFDDTGIGYFAEKVKLSDGAQTIKAWDKDAAIKEIKEALLEDRDIDDHKALNHVYSRLEGFEPGEYGYHQMLEAFEDLTHNIHCEELCEYGRGYSETFRNDSEYDL